MSVAEYMIFGFFWKWLPSIFSVFSVNACYYLILSFIYEICATIFSAKNFKISKDRSGLTRSAVFPDLFSMCCITWDQNLPSSLMLLLFMSVFSME